jgi:hypothetical protein
LDTPEARRAYDSLQIESEKVRAEAASVKEAAEQTSAKMRKWFDETAVPEYKEMERRAIAAEAEAAKARTAWQSAQERGLVDVAQLEALGYKKEAASAAPVAATSGFDEKAWNQRLVDIANGAGDGLAAMQDLVMEHSVLFPDKPLRVRELRAEAMRAGKNVDEFWTTKYNVVAAREAREKKIKEEYESKLRAEGAATERAKFASEYANPATRPLSPSSNPWTKRPDSGRDKQPWDRQDDASVDRVQRATEKLITRMSQQTTH